VFTQCPECQTTFRVTAAMLKAAQGRVRCGRCSQVFNALESLIESEEPADQTPANGEVPYDPADVGSEDIPESALEFTADDLSKVFVVQTPPAPAPAPKPEYESESSDDETAEHEILDIELETPEPPEVITLEGDSVILGEADPSVSDEYFLDEENEAGDTDVAPAPDVGSARPAAPTAHTKVRSIDIADEEVRREIEAAFAADPATRAEFTLPSGKRLEIGKGTTATVQDGDAGDALEAAAERRRRVARGWSIASGALALLLVLQLVHHNRQSLVRNGAIGGVIAGIYAGFGSELSPEWNVNAYELRQFGAATDANAGGTLRVRASLMNGAKHAQPYPLLRLTLQDRFGGQVGLRDLEPREYLRSVPDRNALIGAGQRVDADIAIVDPGKDAVGFEIDVCLRASPTRITCAGDSARSTSG
jgi:predicted Zn finger-like uncharacterized protein